MSPSSRSSSPATRRARTVFPAPDGPSKQKSSPGAISSDAPSTAATCPYRLTSPSTMTRIMERPAFTLVQDRSRGRGERGSVAPVAEPAGGKPRDTTIPLPCPGCPFPAQPGTEPRFAHQAATGRLRQLGQHRVIDRPGRPQPALHQPEPRFGIGSDLAGKVLDHGEGNITSPGLELLDRCRRPGGRLG